MLFRGFTILGVMLLSPTLAAGQPGVVETRAGDRLMGQLVRIDQGVLYLETTYAGTLEIDQDQVLSFSSETPMNLRLEDGTTMSGPIAAAEEGPAGDKGLLTVRGEEGYRQVDPDRVAALWQTSAEDPAVVLAARQQRRWQYEAGLDLTGKEGNTREFGLGADFVATLKGPDDTLQLISEYERRETDGEKTTDRMLGAIDYEAFFHELWGWYARTALETDDIDQINLRSTTGAGISFRLLNREYQSLVARGGVGYRYTNYDNFSSESDPTLDLGLFHRYELTPYWRLRNELTYSPSIADFNEYRIVHDSSLETPVGLGEFWKLRLGVRHDYDNQAVVDKRLDTTYYLRLILSWQ